MTYRLARHLKEVTKARMVMFIERYLYSSRPHLYMLLCAMHIVSSFYSHDNDVLHCVNMCDVDFGIRDARNGRFQTRTRPNAERECELESFKTHACW